MIDTPVTQKYPPTRHAPRPHARRLLRGIARGTVLCALSLAVLLAVLCVLIVLQGQRDEAQPAGAAIVLGAAQINGEPSPVLQARLDHAVDLYRAGTVEKVILTGGVGTGETVSEAAAGRDYLIAQRVPSSTLLLEERGTTTGESVTNAAEIARSNGISSVVLVSDPFHMLRSLKMARDMHLNAYGSPTRSSPISRSRVEETRFVLREAWLYLVYVFARQ